MYLHIMYRIMLTVCMIIHAILKELFGILKFQRISEFYSHLCMKMWFISFNCYVWCYNCTMGYVLVSPADNIAVKVVPVILDTHLIWRSLSKREAVRWTLISL